jgi:hypothetical protein
MQGLITLGQPHLKNMPSLGRKQTFFNDLFTQVEMKYTHCIYETPRKESGELLVHS